MYFDPLPNPDLFVSLQPQIEEAEFLRQTGHDTMNRVWKEYAGMVVAPNNSFWLHDKDSQYRYTHRTTLLTRQATVAKILLDILDSSSQWAKLRGEELLKMAMEQFHHPAGLLRLKPKQHGQ